MNTLNSAEYYGLCKLSYTNLYIICECVDLFSVGLSNFFSHSLYFMLLKKEIQGKAEASLMTHHRPVKKVSKYETPPLKLPQSSTFI